MPAKLLKARQEGSQFVIAIHLDTERVDGAGQPDPLWVREWRWGQDVPEATAIAESKLLAAQELVLLTPGPASEAEGEEFDL